VKNYIQEENHKKFVKFLEYILTKLYVTTLKISKVNLFTYIQNTCCVISC